MGPFAVPEKIVGLTLFLDFFDRGTINLKQICLWDLARIIWIAFIIQTGWAI